MVSSLIRLPEVGSHRVTKHNDKLNLPLNCKDMKGETHGTCSMLTTPSANPDRITKAYLQQLQQVAQQPPQ